MGKNQDYFKIESNKKKRPDRRKQSPGGQAGSSRKTDYGIRYLNVEESGNFT